MDFDHCLGVQGRHSRRVVTYGEPVVDHDSSKSEVLKSSIATVHQGQQEHWEERSTEERSKECSPESKSIAIGTDDPKAHDLLPESSSRGQPSGRQVHDEKDPYQEFVQPMRRNRNRIVVEKKRSQAMLTMTTPRT